MSMTWWTRFARGGDRRHHPGLVELPELRPDRARWGVDIYLSVDRRVIDGGLAARAIRALEAMLNGPVLDELRALAGTS